ncbi:hypothetical protein [Robertmurraya korlensis]|uniref:hypothetical protein n=1 Tax=Robertmurraya korlensis TaxID=519977 RepID=UPI00082420B5|nr:hypothetical protein [Robertmurraya korlensis]
MNGLGLFFDITVQLIKLYQSAGDRDERLKETERLLELREGAMRDATPPASEADRELVKKCMQLNDHLNALFTKERLNIQKDIKELKVKKVTTNKYVNPYENYNPDGVFYDRKK